MTAICLTAYAASVMAMFGTVCVVHKYSSSSGPGHSGPHNSTAPSDRQSSVFSLADADAAAFGNDSAEILPGTGRKRVKRQACSLLKDVIHLLKSKHLVTTLLENLILRVKIPFKNQPRNITKFAAS